MEKSLKDATTDYDKMIAKAKLEDLAGEAEIYFEQITNNWCSLLFEADRIALNAKNEITHVLQNKTEFYECEVLQEWTQLQENLADEFSDVSSVNVYESEFT